MKRKRFSEEQIVTALRQVESGFPVGGGPRSGEGGRCVHPATGDYSETADSADRWIAAFIREKARNSKSYRPLEIGSGGGI